MGIKRIVDTSFWTDGKMDDFSPEDKYFWLYLLTNPFSKQLGIYEISIKQAAFQMGYSVDAFNVLLDRFEKKYGVILFSRETNEVAILNFLRHSVMKGGKPVEDCIKKEMTLVKNRRLIDIVFSHLYGRDDLNETVEKIINEYMKDIDNQNDNDNENERTPSVSCDDSSDDSSDEQPKQPERSKKKKESEPKHKHGENKKVLLTDTEFDRLADTYGEELRDKAIAYLDMYIAEKGYKSQSHNLTIRRWVVDAVKERMGKNVQGTKQIVYQKQTKADDLEGFYNMAKEWAET